MPTPVAHTLAGVGVYFASKRSGRIEDRCLLAGVIVSGCFADVDFGIGFVAGENYHHYFTHSLGFNSLYAVAAYVLCKLLRRPRPLHDTLILASAYLSHVLLDMLSKDTAEPYGVELFWPFSNEFYISPVLVFDNIARGSVALLFGLHNWLAVAREVLVLAPIVAAIWWRAARLNSESR